MRSKHSARRLPASRSGGGEAFDWSIDFAEVFIKGGFDIVLANPPYISGISSDKVEGYRDQIRSLFEAAQGTFDVYVVFYELALRICKLNGAASLITPNKVLSADYAGGLRALLLQQSVPASVLDLSQAQPFGAAVYPVVLTYFKRPASQNSSVQLYRGERSGSDYFVRFEVSTLVSLIASFPAGVWSPLLSDRFGRYAFIFGSSQTLEDVCTVRQSASVDEAYKVFAPLLRESGPRRPARSVRFVISGTIDRYTQFWGKRMRYLKTAYTSPVLEIASPPLNDERLHQIKSSKIIVSGQALHPKAFWDRTAEYASGIPTVLLYDATVPLGYLCAVVNSAVFADMYDILWSTLAMSGGYLRFGPPQLKKIPVPRASLETMMQIQNMVEMRQDLASLSDNSEDEIATCELRIERAVCELYGIALSATSRYAGLGQHNKVDA